jgi:Ni/Fe-hydrogenase subunit HybB-like protein
MSAHHEETAPVGGDILTRPFVVLSAIFAATLVVVAYRFAFGLGSITALSDGYAWGAWKPFSVIVMTAMASGGYAMAVLVYVLNRFQYHRLARTALLTSVLGYTAGILTLGVDIGRPWNFVRIPMVWNWNLHSVLLEVTVCITLYVLVMWLELSAPFLEVVCRSSNPRIRTFGDKWLARSNKLFPWIVALAVVLPSMHQSSLGSLFLLAGPRIHAHAFTRCGRRRSFRCSSSCRATSWDSRRCPSSRCSRAWCGVAARKHGCSGQ